MRRIALALALLTTAAHADTLVIQDGQQLKTYSGVVVQIQHANHIGRLDFGATGGKVTSDNSLPPLGQGAWTVTVNGQERTGCQLIWTRFAAKGEFSVGFGCDPL